MSLDKRKCDPALGKEVHDYLNMIGMGTPQTNLNYSVKERISLISEHMTEILKVLGLNLEDDSLAETPLRVAKMYVSELFYGLDTDTFPKCTVVDNKMKYDEMVVVRGISVTSVCEHHLQNISGTATIEIGRAHV